jgi:DNA-binding PadR family transcriptional regulator
MSQTLLMPTVVPSLSGKERLVLELLASKQDRMYGLELVAESGGQLKRGTVYVLLGRMQQKGYVETEPEKHADDSGLVPRRMYRATAHGLRVLRAWAVAAETLAWEAGT